MSDANGSMNDAQRNIVNMYTDGGCAGNQSDENLGGWGAILEFREHKKELYGNAANTTNNRMELTAVIQAFRALKRDGLTIRVFTDSSYVAGCFRDGWYRNWQRNGWKTSKKEPVENRELWEELIEMVEKNHVTFYRVKGHVDLTRKNTDSAKHYEKFCSWNGGEFSFDDFCYITDMNNRADELANLGIDEIR